MTQQVAARQVAAPAHRPTMTRWPWLPITGVFMAITLGLTVVVTVVHLRSGTMGHTGLPWLDGWYRWDSAWYWRIAAGGYFYHPGHQSSIAFFPVFPLAARALAPFVGGTQIAGQVVAVGSGLVAVLLFSRWVWNRLPRRSAVLAIAVLLTYPYSLFLHGPMYADATYLALAVGAFLLVDRRRYLAAGLVGALAVASRPFGVAVAVGLAVRALEMLARDEGGRGWQNLRAAVTRVRPRQATVLIAFGGLLAWMTYLWARFGNPLAFVETESAPGWDQGVGPATWFKQAFFESLANGTWGLRLNLGLQAVICLLVVLLVPRVVRRFGWGYAAYTAVMIAIPIVGTKDFMGSGRYALAAFPALAAAGDWLAQRPKWLARSVPVAMAVVLGVLTWYYTNMVEIS
ncbi:MAG: hypothetical protein KJ792_03790 [Actinobacteria bacterium]|nr:hypothetical protein [Actinomycetota bacterium]MCG2802541.1 hypothetical protein [Cellulomonas sp.]